MQKITGGPATVPWKEQDVWLGLSTFVIWIVVVFGFRFIIDQIGRDSLGIDVGLFVSLAELILFVPVWFFTIYKYQASLADLGLRSFLPSALRMGCFLMILSFGFNALYATLLARFGQRMQVDLIPVFAELSSPWLFFLGGAVIAPLIEEIFFRGLSLPDCGRATAGRWRR